MLGELLSLKQKHFLQPLIVINHVERGRPTLLGQREIEKTLRECFLKGFTESGTISQTGIGKNTVSKYFKKWNDELVKQDREEFFQSFDNAKYRLRLALDNQLQELYKIQDDLNQEINHHKSENNGKILPGKGLYKERIKISNQICEFLYKSYGVSIVNIPQRLEDLTQKEYELLDKKQFEQEEQQRKIKRIRQSMSNSSRN